MFLVKPPLPGKLMGVDSSLMMGLTAWYPLNEMSGNKVKNYTRLATYSRDATLTNSPKFGSALGHGMTFVAASSQSIDTGLNGAFNYPATKFSFSLWFRVYTVGVTQVLLGHTGISNLGGWGLFFLSDNTIQISGKQDGTSAAAYARSSASTFTAGKFHHIAVNVTTSATASGNTASIYIDGTLNQGAEIQTFGSSWTSPDTTLTIAVRNIGNPLDGQMADIRFWNRHLRQSEITTLASAPLVGFNNYNTIFPQAAAATTTNKQYSFVAG